MRNHLHVIVITLLSVPLTCPAALSGGATVFYVDIDATGASDGSSWENAFNDLQDALALPAGPEVEIRVAEGIYKPTQGSDRTATFSLRNNLTIRGGKSTFRFPRVC